MRCFLTGLGPLAVLLVVLVACSGGGPSSEAPAAESSEPVAANADTAVETPADRWWASWRALCGKAYAGRLASEDPVDAEFGEQTMVMHVRRCAEDRIEVPFHVGEDRSRTWVLTRAADGIQLQHDHRHEDGSEDVVTLYGGRTVDGGTATSQDFPADDRSKVLFEANDLTASVANVWTLEIVPGERVSYILRRPQRHFQVDFDLAAPVEPPPAPWGHEAIDG